MKNNSEYSNWKTIVPRGKHHNKTEKKTTVSLYLSKKVVEKARFHKLNLSRVSEQALISILDYLETLNRQSSDFFNERSFLKESSWCGRRDLNPGSRLGKPGSYLARLRPQSVQD
jgi:hypothetical protein